MNRFWAGVLCVPLAGLALGGCDDGSQARLIATYRAADFATSTSHLSRTSLKLSTTFDLGYAYEVTSRRLEYAPAAVEAPPPIDDHGELVKPKYVSALDPTLLDEHGEPIPGRRKGGVLEVELPSRVFGAGQLYYRWVIEYTSGGDRLTMRKSDIFRAGREREEPESLDERVSF